jgi:hypothetical protein
VLGNGACPGATGFARLFGSTLMWVTPAKEEERGMSSCDFTAWRKATYSEANANCVEVGWRKASYSAASANCIAIAAERRVVGVRDAKQCGAGSVLEFPAAAWRAFIATAKESR